MFSSATFLFHTVINLHIVLMRPFPMRIFISTEFIVSVEKSYKKKLDFTKMAGQTVAYNLKLIFNDINTVRLFAFSWTNRTWKSL